MKAGTQLIIGLTVIAIGVGVVALGFVDQEQDVRQLSEVLADPGAHTSGSYTLVGVPQPQRLATFADGGAQQPNPDYQDTTQRVVAWQRDGTTYHTTLRLTVDGPHDGESHWSLRNETRIPGQAGPALPVTYQNWTIDVPHMVFLIQGFPDANGDMPTIFGVYQGVLRDPMQPKPSQFRGHLATTLPDGSPLPAGALVYDVQEYTAGCSSKFIPEEYDERDHAANVTF